MQKKLGEQLLSDAKRRIISKDDLLEACLKTLTDDQIYEIAIANDFVMTENEDANIDMENSPQQRIIDAVLARHGD
tara:strand:- start:31926 stop:32153 length:228 start_codon:yes stop_codon:yes gene_type:complete